MKRFLLFIIVIALVLCTMTGCSRRTEQAPLPTSEELKAIIPEKVELSAANYPYLEKDIPTPQSEIAKLPKEYLTFSFDESKWVYDEATTEYYKKMYKDLDYYGEDSTSTYYMPADGSKEMQLYYDAEYNCYNLFVGLVEENEEGISLYQEDLYYNENGNLEYYYNYDTYLEIDAYEGYDTQSVSMIREGNRYTYNYEFGKLDYISVTEESVMDYDAEFSKGFSFSYYPEAKAFRDITYDHFNNSEDEYIYYTAYYTNEGLLDSIDYYSYNDMATYDGNYQLNEEAAQEYSFIDYLKELFTFYIG